MIKFVLICAVIIAGAQFGHMVENDAVGLLLIAAGAYLIATWGNV